MKDMRLEKYAQLIIRTGVNIQKDQILVINSPIECASFTRMLAQNAYQEGARDVVINWTDELFSRIRFINAPEEVFDEFPQWQKEFYLSYLRQGAAFLSISASDPELLKGVNNERISRAQKTSNAALKEYRESRMKNDVAWCVVSIPTKSWANKVFPDISEDEAVDRLWTAIFKSVRVDVKDPVAAWQNHNNNLRKTADFLNTNNFKFLRYKNSIGTDVQIEFPEGHIWHGGSTHTADGVEFIPNLPTEEVFTLPKKTGVNGVVVSSKPLNYQGNLIDGFSFTFKEGRIVDFGAKQGYEILEKLIGTDEGSHYLGEVALVPYNSPISNSNILFFNTLFDENASCHLAIGKAYPTCLKDSESMSEAELEKSGVNDSLVHVDFMIGTADLEIIGITSNGQEVPVFKNGNVDFL
jgi:aminopeptidase